MISAGNIIEGSSLGIGFASFGLACAGVTYGLPRILTRREKRRQAAVAEVAEKVTHIPSTNLSMNIDSMPDSISIPQGSVSTDELITVLQDLQTRHLTSEQASIHAAKHPETINPAMIVKGGIARLSEENRGRFLHPIFDRVQEIRDLSTSLKQHAPLKATRSGHEALRQHTTSLLGHLGTVAATFVDLRVADVTPQLEHLGDIADDPHFKTGLEEAKATLWRPELSHRRYKLAMEDWGDAAGQTA